MTVNFFKKFSLKTQIFILIFIHLISIPLLITIYYNSISSNLISKKTKENIAITKALQNGIEALHNDTATIMFYTGYSDSCVSFLTSEVTYQSYNDIRNLLDIPANFNKDIFNISITSTNNTSYSLPGYQSPLAPKCLDYDDGKLHYDGFAKIKTASSLYVPVFSYSMNIIAYGNQKSSGKIVGHIVFLVRADSVVKEVSDFTSLSNTSLYMVDSFEKVICLSDPLSLGEENSIVSEVQNSISDYMVVNHTAESKTLNVPYYTDSSGKEVVKYMIQVNTLKDGEGYTIAITPYSSLLEDAIIIRNMCYSMGLLLAIITLIIYIFIIRNVVSPLNVLMNYIVSLSHGNLKIMKKRVELKGYKEIESISTEFNKMMDEINQMREQLFITTSSLYERKVADKESINHSLLDQINPHFLFNTLDVIKGSVLMSGNRELFTLCSSLAAIMQYSLKEDLSSTIKDELSIINHFMQITDYRFGDRIDWDIDFEEEIFEYPLPRLVLYQYVYNAVVSRIEPLPKKGMISMVIKTEDTNLVITVQDNGSEFSNNKKEMNLINNIEMRLKSFYSKESKVSHFVNSKGLNELTIILESF